MAIQKPLMIKCVLGNTDLSMTPQVGQAMRIWDVQIYNPLTSYITLTIDQATVGYFRVGGGLGNHLSFISRRNAHSHDWILGTEGGAMTPKIYPVTNAGGASSTMEYAASTGKAGTYRRVGQLSNKFLAQDKTVLGLLRSLGIFTGYPVEQGQTFTITGAKQANAIQLCVYEVADAADIHSTDPNGSNATIRQFLSYGNTGGTINVSGSTVYNTVVNPAQFPNFPFAALVPAKKQIEILGVLASDVAPAANDGTNYLLTNYLKFIMNQETLFDPDLNGLLLASLLSTEQGSMDAVGEGMSIVGNYSDVDGRPPFILPTPLLCQQGDELNVYLTTTKAGTGQTISTALQEIALIERVTIVS